jgi:hypothetical protein
MLLILFLGVPTVVTAFRLHPFGTQGRLTRALVSTWDLIKWFRREVSASIGRRKVRPTRVSCLAVGRLLHIPPRQRAARKTRERCFDKTRSGD